MIVTLCPECGQIQQRYNEDDLAEYKSVEEPERCITCFNQPQTAEQKLLKAIFGS